MRTSVFFAGALAAFFLFQTVAEAQWVITPQTGRMIRPSRMPKETPELQMEYARTLMVEGKYKDALDETNKFQSFYGDTDFADANQFLRGEIYMAMDKPAKAVQEFQMVITSYPESDYFDEVIEKQYEIADAYYDEGVANQDQGWWRIRRNRPFKRAIEVYTMVIDNQPFTAEAAEAQYKVGLCQYTVGNYIEAAYEYRRVIEDYAGSDWVDDAAYGLCMCYYAASMPPEYDQSPSQLTIAAIDEFNSRFPTDARGAELDVIRKEMYERVAQQRLLTARYYEKRRKFDAAAISYNVIVEQFPGTPAASEAESWLQARPELAEVGATL